jgi:hypothetical protein
LKQKLEQDLLLELQNSRKISIFEAESIFNVRMRQVNKIRFWVVFGGWNTV